MKIKKVTNIGLKISDDTIIPCLRVVLSDYAGTYNTAYMQEFMEEIYTRSIGGVSSAGSWASGVEAMTTYVDLTNGTYTYGDDTGFKYVITASSSTVGLNKQQTITGNLYYKGDQMGAAYVYTGYSAYEVGYLIIYTDEQYRLIYTSSFQSGFQLRDSTPPGVGLYADSIPVCAVYNGNFNTFVTQTTFNGTPGDSIQDKITGETKVDTDPYKPGGVTGDDNTGGNGGKGKFKDDDDPIDIPPLPTLSAADTGFITIFNPSVSQLQALANYMWSGPFDLSTYKKIFADPMDCILGLSIVPVNVPGSTTKAVTVGNISTGVNMTVASSQYVEIDCGSLDVQEFWGAYLDYEPYTRFEIYLPYIGTHALSADDVMGKTIKVVYHIDVLSGACTAFVKCGTSVLYSFNGQCSSSIPITGNDFTNVVNGILHIAGAVGTMVATGGASAPMNVAGAVAAGAPIASTAVNYLKPSVEKSGSMSGTGGMLSIQKPYLIKTRPQQAVPSYQNAILGYPSFITKTLSAAQGYTEVEDVHLENIPATDNEIAEIKQLLRMGVIL